MSRVTDVRALGLPAGLVGAQALGVGALLVRDPHQPGSWGSCPFLAVTGLPCPFCGGMRAVSSLAHGDLTAALHSNGYATVVVLLVAVASLAWLVDDVRSRRAGRPSRVDPLLDRAPVGRVLGAVLAGWLVFGVLRW